MAAGLVTVGMAVSAGLQTSANKAEMNDLVRQMQAATPTPSSPGAATASAAAGSTATAAAAGAADIGSAAPPSGISSVGGRVKILTNGPLAFQWKDGSLSTFIHIWNSGAAPEKATFSVLVHDPKSKLRAFDLAAPAEPVALPPRGLTSSRVEFKPFQETGECAPPQATGGPLWISISASSPCFPLSGLLVIRNEQTAPGPTKKLADPETTPVGIVLPPHPASDQVQSQILLHSLWIAIVPVVIAVILAWKKSRHPLAEVGGSPDWDFSKSWSANVTLFAGLLSALLTFAGLPSQTVILPKNSYLILSIIAISMIGIGPLIFASIQRNGHGILATLFVSGLVVLWAAFIQFGLVWLIFAELVLANVITPSSNQILDVGLIVTGAMLLIYAVVGLRQVAIASEPAAMAAKALAAKAAGVPAAEPTWHLL